MRVTISMRSDGSAVIVAANRTIIVRLGDGLGAAVLAMPQLMSQLVNAGVTELVISGRAERDGRLPAAAWALLEPKSNAAHEAARKEALETLRAANVRLVTQFVSINSVNELATALSGSDAAGDAAAPAGGAFGD